MSPPRHVLVVRFSSLGDVILTTPFLRALRARLPGSRITFVTKAAWVPLFHASPLFDVLETLAPGEPVRSLAARLRRERHDLGLDLHGSLRSRALRLLVGGTWRTTPRHRMARRLHIAFRRPLPALPPVAERHFATAGDLDVVPDGLPAAVTVSADARRRAAALAPSSFVALAPGASRFTKRWPPAAWRDLAARLAAAGTPAVGVGTQDEASLLGDAARPAFGAGLDVTAALLARARIVVANDSGLMHLATAVGTPVVALFGPTVPELGFAPYRAPARVLERTLACRPCAPYGSPRCPLGHHRCMIDLTPDEVFQAVRAAA